MKPAASLFVLAIAASVLPTGSAGAGPAELAGVSAAVRGDVALSRAQGAARGVRSGEKIFLEDSLRSGSDSGMQVLLLDETVFTLGADSEIVIDEFVYDPATGRGKLDAEVVQGVFRFVSGKIAKEKPEDVRLRVPSGTIGIRGTIVAGEVAPDGSALVVLLGPGRNANTQDRPGAVRVEAAGRSVDLVRPNWATRIPGPGQAPSDPFPMALPDLQQLSLALSPGAAAPPERRVAPRPGPAPEPGAGEGDPGPGATELSGQATASGGKFGTKLLSEVAKVANVKTLDGIAGQMPFSQSQIATVEQLAAITSGAAVYNRPGFSFAGGGGFDFGFVLDFGQQRASFGMQNITSPILMMPPGNGVALNAIATDFATGSNGQARFAIPASFAYGAVCNPCNVLVDADVLNNGGQIAAAIAAKVHVQGSGQSATADLGEIPGFFVP